MKAQYEQVICYTLTSGFQFCKTEGKVPGKKHIVTSCINLQFTLLALVRGRFDLSIRTLNLDSFQKSDNAF